METEDMKELINRLTEWLEKNGHTYEEIVECIRYITKTK